ncbi:RING finger protein 112-like protein, partial [Dinothrombium tinctorium]
MSQQRACQILNEKFEINSSNLEKILSSYPDLCDKPINLITIVGDTRKGKSLLLSILLQHLKSKSNDLTWQCSPDEVLNLKQFEWSNNSTSLTDGMWIWPEPLYVVGVEDPILLCDSQGTFGSNMDHESSTKIFGI